MKLSNFSCTYKFLLGFLIFNCFFITKIFSFEYQGKHYIADPLPSSTIYKMRFNQEKKFVWFVVSKAGCTSIKYILKNNNLDVPIFDKAFRPNKYKNYFKFGFVRNPWARIVSCYFNKVVSKEKRMLYYKECFGKDFDYFVDFVNKRDLSTADHHIRLQTRLLPLAHLDYVGRLENFDNDIRHVMKILEFEKLEIPRKNETQHLHYSHYYTERTKQIIAQKYRDDIATFGYEFENK
jgi:hypothetical protein